MNLRSVATVVGTFLALLLSRPCLPGQGLLKDKNRANDGKTAAPLIEKHPIKLVAQLGHASDVTSVAFSPHGKQVLTGSRDKTARLWDVASGKELRRFEGHTDGISSVAFSKDGKQVLTGSWDKTARLWDADSGKEIGRFEGHADAVLAVAFSPVDKKVLTGSRDKTAWLWSDKKVFRFEGHVDRVTSVAFSPDGKQVLTASGGERPFFSNDKTARVWDASTGKEIRRFEGHSKGVLSVAFSPNGKKIATSGCDGRLRIWDIATGWSEDLGDRGFGGLQRLEMIWVAFSADGKQLLTARLDGAVSVWDVARGEVLREIQEVGPFEGDPIIRAAALSPDGKQVVTANMLNGGVRLWEVSSGKGIRRFAGLTWRVERTALTRDGKYLVTGASHQARFWDTASGKEMQQFEGHSQHSAFGKAQPEELLAISENGKQVLTRSNANNEARLWDALTGKEVHRFAHTRMPRCAAFSKDDKFIVTASYDQTARVWNAITGKELSVLTGHLSDIYSVAFSPCGKTVLTGSRDKTARLWDAATGKEIRVFEGHTEDIKSVAFSSDSNRILTGSGDHTARLWDANNGKEIHRFEGHTWIVTSVAFSPNGKQVLTGSWDGTARLWDAVSGHPIRRFVGHTGYVESVAFSVDGKQILTGSWDGTARFWDAASGKELCSLLSFRDGSWAVIDSAGRFDAANGGNVEGLHWVAGNEPIALSQLKKYYYDPGLLAKYMGFNKRPLRKVQGLKEITLFPVAEVAPPEKDSNKLTLKLANQGGGIGKVQMFVNGREVEADVRGEQLKLQPDAASATLPIDLAGAEDILLPGETNNVRIVTWNKEGYLSSRGLNLDWVPVGRKDDRPIELYAIVAGISHYAGEDLKLRFAAKDAQDMAKALVTGGQRLFGAGKVHLTLLCDSEDPKALAPTRANLEKAFLDARKARRTDILVVYLAGHGIAVPKGEEETYYYLTKEADRETFQDAELRPQIAITSEELTEWIKKIPALKQVLILDTCAAGAAETKLIATREVNAEQIRAIDQMKDRTGFHVLMGCAADRVSYEASRYSQGLLTYALLQGMRGAALDGELVNVGKLFRFAEEQVPQLARFVGGIQRPLVLSSKSNIWVGQLLAEDRKQIPLALVRPLVLRPLLLNPEEKADTLSLSTQLRKRLAEESHVQGRGQGKAPELVYLDTDEFPGAISPSGTYTLKGDKVQVELVLRRDGQTLASFQVEGVRTDLPGLVVRLMAAVMKHLPSP